MRIHYRDDFTLTCRLTDAEGITIESFPACDFTGEVSAGAGTPFRFGRKDGRCTNCAVDADTLTVILDNHRLLPGTVSVKITFAFPDNIYPDGIRSNVAMTGGNLTADAIELVEGPGDNAPIPAIEVQLPIIVRSAYDLAVAAGYTGTKEEYAALLFALPEAVSSVQEMSTLTSDWAAGKRMVVDALNDRGVPTDPDASFASIADNLRSLPLPVEGEEGWVSPAFMGLPGTYDLLNEMRNHPRLDYPYMAAVSFDQGQETVRLEGADAYLCDDGFFTEEQGVSHTFTNQGTAFEHYIIYYHRSGSYTFTPIVSGGFKHHAYCILNGDYVTVGDLGNSSGHTFLSYATGTLDLQASLNSNTRMAAFRNPRMVGKPIFYNTTSMATLSLPYLEYAACETTSGQCSFKDYYLPRLREVSGIQLLLRGTMPTELELPSLETFCEGEYNRHIIWADVTNLRVLRLPKLRGLSGGAWTASNISYGALTDIDIYMPEVMDFRGSVSSVTNSSNVRIHLGRQQEAEYLWIRCSTDNNGALPCITEVTVLPGFRSSIQLQRNSALTASSLSALIANLGDNTGHPTLTLTLGATNIAKLSAEDIALAQAKNYNIE